MTAEDRIKELEIEWEAKLLRQEHRPWLIFWNYWKRRSRWEDPNDVRRIAVEKALVWRLISSPTTIALGSGGLIAILTLFFLYQQNLLFKNQNDLFKTQNERIDQQTKLLEASRRSSQMFIMSEVLSDLNDETRNAYGDTLEISRGLIGRISALSRSMKPYYFLEDSLIIDKKISPERGQLLIALLSVRISEDQLSEIIDNGIFDYAELEGITVRNKDLTDIKLNEAKLSRSVFLNTILDVDGLGGANLTDCQFVDCSIKHAPGAINGANFANSLFESGEISSQELETREVDFSHSTFHEILIKGQFSSSSFKEVRFLNSTMEGVDFFSCDFSGSTFWFSDESGRIDFHENCILDSVEVPNGTWFDFIKDRSMSRNYKRLISTYKIDSLHHGENSYSYYLVRKKPRNPTQ